MKRSHAKIPDCSLTAPAASCCGDGSLHGDSHPVRCAPAGHCGAAAPAQDAEARFAWAMDFCREAQLVMTPAREKALRFLAARRSPASADMISQSDALRGNCDAVTIYRTLGLFKDIDLVRRVGLHKRNSYFVLNAPGAASHYLICRHCDAVVEVPCDDPVQVWAERVASIHGFAVAKHELEVYGVCPACQKSKRDEVRPTKLRRR